MATFQQIRRFFFLEGVKTQRTLFEVINFRYKLLLLDTILYHYLFEFIYTPSAHQITFNNRTKISQFLKIRKILFFTKEI